jgi:hypothetical protein
LSFIPWEEGAEGLEGLLLAKKIKAYIDVPDALPGIPQESNETILCKKRETYKNK